MNKILCSARSIECDCGPYECRNAQPSPVPVIRFSLLTQAAIIFFLAALIIIPVAYAALASADEAFRRQQLDQQELTWTK